ncbi:VWA domain-containing protein [Granulicella sp. dw_53]|uniref:VWA domain-containing protein n=1 Tax=Granulicella sp. dw_53 TaxID=2719792 RepID=UPI001BD620C6|nr:VWA domain-containing protein [Granulicella sp. dw_53]
MRKLLASALLLWVPALFAQNPPPQEPQTPTLTSRTTLVLVPALVTTKAGEPVFTLQAKDFVVTDDGVEQKISLEEDTGGEPLALVVVIETGGSAVPQMDKYRGLGPLIEAVVGGVPHKVAVVEFDSEAGVSQNFTQDLDKVSSTIERMAEGDAGGAIFDGLGLAVEILAKQPPQYRRAILLISETIDHGSHLKADEALRTISDTNTAIYSLGFSSTRSQMKHETGEMLGSSEPGPPGGCMADDPNADPAAKRNKATQAYDCLSLLAPPLRLAKMAAIAARNGFRQNVPETVARVSGGEYFKFSDLKGLERDLTRISNHMSNRYVLSFHPQAPHAGLHAIGVTLSEYKGVTVTARNGYWVDEEAATAPKP